MASGGAAGGAGSPTPSPGRGGLARWAVLSQRNARLLLGTRMIGQASDGLLQAALGSFALFSPERQATAAQVAAAFALLLLPYSVFGPFAGVLLDRWSRVRVLVWANLGRGLITLGIAGLVAAHHTGPSLAVTILVALGLGRLVLAGLSASLPHAVGSEHLVVANSLFPTAGSVASAAATVVGLVGMRLLGTGQPTALVVAVAAGMVTAGLTARLIPRRDLGPTAEERPVGRRIRDDLRGVFVGMLAGLAHLRARPAAARPLITVVLHRVAFGAMLINLLLIVRVTLNTPEQAESALTDFAAAGAAAAAGAMVAALVTPRAVAWWGMARWPALVLGVAAIVCPLATAMLRLPTLMLSSAVLGFAGQTVKIVGDTALQRNVADDYRGRVFSLYDVLLNAGLVTGIVVAAFGSSGTGQAPGLWAAMGILLAATALWTLRPLPRSG